MTSGDCSCDACVGNRLTSQDGYVVDLDKQKLEGAPTYDQDGDFNWTPEYGRKVDSFYNVPSYWM